MFSAAAGAVSDARFREDGREGKAVERGSRVLDRGEAGWGEDSAAHDCRSQLKGGKKVCLLVEERERVYVPLWARAFP